MNHLAQLRDLTEKLNEKDAKLVESERRMREFFHKTTLPMALASLSQQSFVEVNEALCITLGLAADELTSKKFFEFMAPEEREYHQRRLAQRIKDRSEGKYAVNPTVVKYLAKSGDPTWIWWHIGYSPSDTDIMHLVGVDVTEEMRLKRRVEELESRSRTSDPEL